MKLTFDQLKSILTGCMEISQNTDGSACVRRMTARQRAPYLKNRPGHAFPCEYSTNITLDFCTDATSAAVTLRGRRRKMNAEITVDLLVDNVPAQSVCYLQEAEESTDATDYGPHTFRFTLPGKTCRVTLQLPYSNTVDSLTLELSDGAGLQPYVHSRTLVAFGDSITYGATASRPSLTYISRLARMLDAKVHNFSIGGERFLDWKIIPGTYPKADFVIAAYGSNDYGQKKYCHELFRQKMPVFFQKLHEAFPQTPIFVLLPLWRLNEDEPQNDIPNLQTVRDAVRKEIGQYPNMTAVDCQDFIPHEPKYFADARLHPNNEGMALYANAVYEAIRGKI